MSVKDFLNTSKFKLFTTVLLFTILPVSVASVFVIKQYRGRAYLPITPPISGPTILPTPTATPLVYLCNADCLTNNNCSDGLICVFSPQFGKNVCRNINCPSEDNCLCSTPPTNTPKPTSQACIKRGQSVTLTPSLGYSRAGSTLTYTVSVKDNDSFGCLLSNYKLEVTGLPTGWRGVFTNSNLTGAPSKTISTTLKITSPLLAKPANYPFFVKVKGPNAVTTSRGIYSVLPTIK